MIITRSSLIAVLLQKLAEIRVVNGYGCDVGQNVEYAEGIQAEPTQDSIGLMDGLETFGIATGQGRERVLEIVLSAAFVGNAPRARATAGAQDILNWIERNKSLGIRGVSMQPQTMQTALDSLGELAEAVCELKITY